MRAVIERGTLKLSLVVIIIESTVVQPARTRGDRTAVTPPVCRSVSGNSSLKKDKRVNRQE